MEQRPIYPPLDNAQGQIRLLRVLTGSSTEICCHLKVFQIYETRDYKALSYCWTRAEASERITVNGQPFWIRPNLRDFLKLLKTGKRNQWIFVDAMCINQDNIDEKGHQIPLMRHVYENAKQVVVWLGKEEEASRQEITLRWSTARSYP